MTNVSSPPVRQTTLIVEDELSSQMLLRTILQKVGYTILEAQNW